MAYVSLRNGLHRNFKNQLVLIQAASLNDTLEVVAYDIATISDTVSKADGGRFDGLVTFVQAVGQTETNTTATGSLTLDYSANQNFVLTLTGNVTLANPSTEAVGQSGFIVFIQDSTGSRTVFGYGLRNRLARESPYLQRLVPRTLCRI